MILLPTGDAHMRDRNDAESIFHHTLPAKNIVTRHPKHTVSQLVDEFITILAKASKVFQAKVGQVYFIAA